MDAPLPLHLGAMHPYEQALTLLLAFGPFVVLGIVIAVRRRAEADETSAAESGEESLDASVADRGSRPRERERER